MGFVSARKVFIVKLAVFGLIAGTAVLLGATINAQPTGGKIMTDVSLTGGGACKLARIRFDIPIRYVSHFPQKQGDEVRIRLKPLSVSPVDTQALLDREAFSPTDEGVALTNVIYEGDMDGGPSLSLQFSHGVYFTVTQGKDFRSVNVSFSDSAAGCSPASSPKP